MKSTISLIVLIAVLVAMNTRIGSIPPLGKFFDPDAGFWSNAETSEPRSEELNIEGLKGAVSIYYDERRVPHIFAQNEYDLFLAQGYVTAKHRLFQMELQTYDAAGRLSELLGENEAIQRRDLTTRRWGMPWGAENKISLMETDSAANAIMTAYSAGVNALINSLDKADYPLEYKLLDINPEQWKPLKSSLLHMNMSRTLAGGSSDDRTSNTIAYFGYDYVEMMFGTKPKAVQAIIPPSKKWEFEAFSVNEPDSLFIPKTAERVQFFEPDAGVGSNNWAVAGSKTKNGYPILASDPHLSLTMPSIWMELQLHAPGYNAYGVAFQGIPGILIGFNEHIAWAETNTASDVMDWYQIKFKDESKNEYWHDDQWKPTTKRIEEIKVRGSESLIDTVVYTHHGPVMLANPDDTTNAPVYHAMRWIAHEKDRGLLTFVGLNKARNYDEYVDALKNYVVPAQNFVFASNEGDIALWVNGKFPNKWKYQGRTVSDGTDPTYDWQGWIPFEHNPHVKNPPRGFVSSANQESVDDSYPYYLNDEFAPYERGARINSLLSEMEDITVEDFQKMQLDSYSLHAESILPELLAWVHRESLSEEEEEFRMDMFQWDYVMAAESYRASFFRSWFSNFYGSIVNDEYRAADARLRYPSRDRFIEVIKAEPDFFLVDDMKTEKVETVQDIATKSFKVSYSQMISRYGEDPTTWEWGKVSNNDLGHIAQIPGMGVYDVYHGGAPEAINATRGGYGPSWRMVVELGPEVQAWGVFPGGISGNPGSPNYDAFVENWRTGNHFKLNFYREAPENPAYVEILNSKF